MTEALIVDQVRKLRREKRAIPLGRLAGIQEYAASEHSVSVIGPARSGKSSAIFIPAIALHPGPVVVTSLRPDLRDACVRPRQAVARAFGGVVCELRVDEGIAPAPGVAQVSWDLASGCESWNVAQDRSASLLSAAMPGDNEGHWRATGQKLLSSCLLAGRRNGLTAREIRRKLDSRDINDMLVYLEYCARVPEDSEESPDFIDDDAAEAYFALHSTIGEGSAAPDELSSIFSTLTSQALGALRYNTTVGTSPLDPRTFLQGYSTLFVTVRQERAKNVRSWVSAFIEMLTSLWRTLPFEGRPPSLLLALDEVANVAPAASLPSIVTAGGGDGIQLLTGFQKPEQAEIWGPDAGIMLDGTSHSILFPGLVNAPYLESYASLLGAAIKYDKHIEVDESVNGQYRVANAERLRVERTKLEEVVSRYSEGWRNRLAQSAAEVEGLRLYTNRLRHGIDNRPGYDGGVGTLNEVLALTRVTTVSERRHAYEARDLFAGAGPRAALVRSGPRAAYRDFPRHYEDDFWRSLVGL